jgi:putative transposase
MARHLRRQGHVVGRKRVRRLMAKMGLRAVYQRPKTTVPHPEHKVWPYSLRNVVINRPNHVWCADITYIPMRRGFLCLVAIMDWATRKVLARRLSSTMDADFCIAALEEALSRHGRPAIFNTDPFAACWPRPLRGSDRWSPDHRWQPAHQPASHLGSAGGQDQDLDGRARPVARQRVHRAALAEREVRARLPPRL